MDCITIAAIYAHRNIARCQYPSYTKQRIVAFLSLQPLIAITTSFEQHGCSKLHKACFDGGLNEVKALLSSGIDIDQTAQGYTALLAASQTGQYSVVDYLISQGANIEAKNDEGGTWAVNKAIITWLGC